MRDYHCIEDLSLDLRFAAAIPSVAHSEYLRTLVVEHLLPVVETLFDEHDDGDVIWKIDRLDIDLGDVTLRELPARLRDGLAEALGKAMRQGNGAADGSRRISLTQNKIETLLLFLLHGIMTVRKDDASTAAFSGVAMTGIQGWAHEALLGEVLQQAAPQLLLALRTRSRSEQATLAARLARQFSLQQLQLALQSLAPALAHDLLPCVQALRMLLEQAASITWPAALVAVWERILLDLLTNGESTSAHAMLRTALAVVAEGKQKSVSDVARAMQQAWQRVPAHARTAALSSMLEALDVLASAAAVPEQAVPTTPWRVLPNSASPKQLLALIKQSTPAQLRAALRYYFPAQATAWETGMTQLQQLLRQAAIDPTQAEQALLRAWQAIFGRRAHLAIAGYAPVELLMPVIDFLATAIPQARPELLARMQAAAQQIPVDEYFLDALQDAFRTSPPPDDVANVAVHVAEDDDAIAHALRAGQAGHLYACWPLLLGERAEVLRSALLHYGAYAAIGERIALNFPLSMLADLLHLLAPWLGAACIRHWNDPTLAALVGQGHSGSARRWSQWRRHWWSGALHYMTRHPQSMAGHTDLPSPDRQQACLQAALEKATTVLADDVVLAQRFQQWLDQREPARQRNGQTMPELVRPLPAEPWSLQRLQSVLRDEADPAGLEALDLDLLQALLRQAMPDVTCQHAILARAGSVSDARAYYLAVLTALAREEVLDLDALAAMASRQHARQASVAAFAPASAPDPATMYAPPADAASVVQALISADADYLQRDWKLLLQQHGPWLRATVLQYGQSTGVLARLSHGLPAAMLCNLLILVAPEAAPAWRALMAVQIRQQSAMGSPVLLDQLATSGASSPALRELAGTPPAPTSAWPRRTSASFKPIWQAALTYALPLSEGRRQLEEMPESADVRGSHAMIAIALQPDRVIAALCSSMNLRTQGERGQLLAYWQLQMRQDELSELSEQSEPDRLGQQHRQEAPEQARISSALLLQQLKAEALLSGSAEKRVDKPLSASSAMVAGEPAMRSAHVPVQPDIAEVVHRPDAELERISLRLRAGDLALLQVLPPDALRQLILKLLAGQSKTRLRNTTPAQTLNQHAPSDQPALLRYYRFIVLAIMRNELLDFRQLAQRAMREDGTAPDDVMPRSHASAVATPAAEGSTQAQPYLEWLRAAGSHLASSAPPGLAAWLESAGKQRDTGLLHILAELAGDTGALAQLIQRLPSSLLTEWPAPSALLEASRLSASQQQILRRLACDAGELFCSAHAGWTVRQILEFQWNFLWPYLFDRKAVASTATVLQELLTSFVRQSGVTAEPAWLDRVRAQLGQDSAPQTLVEAAVWPITGEEAAQVTFVQDDLPPFGEVAIANAGMVLCAPFLTRLWAALALTRDKGFVAPAAAQRAAMLLQYVVCGSAAAPEYDLLLNKILCGLPTSLPMMAHIDVQPHEQELIEQMLKAMMAHWKPLRSTSLAGLRETFLLRPGYLAMREDGWHLRVEQRSFDVLLDSLPWSFSTIHYPWMPHLLWVQWP